ncbi:MAG: DNA polymerase III subunit delta [Marinobacter sp.]|nr:DNA polymerase III subunit delta [Marinobacter sp.]
MKASAAQLPQLLKKSLAPVYLVSGDEPLLVQEACDEIRAAARAAGYEERLSFQADNALNWNQVGDELGAMSLFASKRRIEIHFPTGKLGDGRNLLEQVLAAPPEDIILLLSSARLDAAETKRKWYKLLQGCGVHVTLWPIEPDKFPAWLQQRARSKGLQLTRGALEMLSERLEGNLLAASQELDRLQLLSPAQTVDEEIVAEAVLNSARFNIFDLVADLLSGNTPQAFKVIGALEQEGENPLGMLTVLSRDLRTALALRQALGRRENAAQFLKSHGVRQPQRARAIENLVRRKDAQALQQGLRLCSDIDRSSKGYGDRTPWDHLRDLAAALT